MVLWEITLGTAYFLGLKRTYKLALKLQRRLIGPKHPRLRQFVQRRTRSAFDVALRVHRNIQERDIEVGRNLGNWILRWLDRMKPSAHIRGSPPANSNGANTTPNMTKQLSNSSNLKTPGSIQTPRNRESDRHMFSSTNAWRKPFPAITMMMRPPRPAGTITQYRHLFSGSEMLASNYTRSGFGFEGVIRKDIMQWMMQN